MANQALAFGELLAGGILVTAALTGESVKTVVSGKAGPLRGFAIGGGGGAQAATPATPTPGEAVPGIIPKDGTLIGKPIDRPGMPTGQKIIDFARRVAGVWGFPITLGTGTSHDRLTTSGNVSAHWSGNALDLPATGEKLTQMGQAALIAAGVPADQARRIRGGLHNVGGYQIIFNTTEGGNHWNHLHIGLRG